MGVPKAQAPGGTNTSVLYQFSPLRASGYSVRLSERGDTQGVVNSLRGITRGRLSRLALKQHASEAALPRRCLKREECQIPLFNRKLTL